MRNSILICALVTFFISFALACDSSQNQAAPTHPNPGAPAKAINSPQEILDPFCCDDVAGPQLKDAWAQFVTDGRYRMVRANEMRDSEARSRRPYAYTWGDLGYDQDPSQSYHLAVIVVDTQLHNDDRFSVVTFSAPRGQGGAYRPYWLLRDQDLSGAFFSGYSGHLEVVINESSGKTKGCDIAWNNSLKKYICAK